jgi:glucose-6-phosphate isomerase, archaeal
MNKKPDIRYLYDIKEIIYDKNWLKKASDFELYYMRRGVKEKNGLRYDITTIPGQMLGKEFVKTKGHKHIGKFKEIYIVLKGQALFLMQKCENNEVKDVYVVKGEKGDAVIIPSEYEHITINPLKENLEIGNWISKNCKNNYETIKKMHGACYFYTKKGWVKNKNYKKIPKLRFEKPLKSIPKNLNFLKQK